MKCDACDEPIENCGADIQLWWDGTLRCGMCSPYFHRTLGGESLGDIADDRACRRFCEERGIRYEKLDMDVEMAALREEGRQQPRLF